MAKLASRNPGGSVKDRIGAAMVAGLVLGRAVPGLDDELDVTADFRWMKGVRQGFHQEITRKSDGAQIATAEVTAVMLQAGSLKPSRLPQWIKNKLEQEH